MKNFQGFTLREVSIEMPRYESQQASPTLMTTSVNSESQRPAVCNSPTLFASSPIAEASCLSLVRPAASLPGTIAPVVQLSAFPAMNKNQRRQFNFNVCTALDQDASSDNSKVSTVTASTIQCASACTTKQTSPMDNLVTCISDAGEQNNRSRSPLENGNQLGKKFECQKVSEYKDEFENSSLFEDISVMVGNKYDVNNHFEVANSELPSYELNQIIHQV